MSPRRAVSNSLDLRFYEYSVPTCNTGIGRPAAHWTVDLVKAAIAELAE